MVVESEPLIEYIETQMAGIARSSRTDASEGAMRAFQNMLTKIKELEKEKPS